MKTLNKKELLITIIFCISIFFISIFTLNKFLYNTINENSEEQLSKANKQNIEVARFKIETTIDNKLDIFIENLLESGAIESNQTYTEKLTELIRNFRKENFIEIMGVIVENKGIFLNENDEIVEIDQNTIHDILSEEKSIFKYSINGVDYLVIKNSLNSDDKNHVTTVYLKKDKSKNKDLIIPVYTGEGCSYVIDNDGQGIFNSTKYGSQVFLNNTFDVILSYSEKNSDEVNKMKLDMLNKKSGIIKYEGPNEKRWMSYAPIGFDDLYLCTMVPQNIIYSNVDEILNLNLISICVIIIDIILIFGFFKFVEKFKIKEFKKIQSLDPVTKGNSYKKFNKELKKIYECKDKELKAIYMAIDLDNFKIVNTILSKQCGDEVLKKVYEILELNIGNDGCYCRRQSDEFLAYYKYKNYEDVENIVNTICESIRNIRLPQNHMLVPSVGVCYMDNKNISIENLEVNAIIAKKKSKNKLNQFYSYFKESNLDEIIDNKNILDDMNNALINKEFRLVYQPKFDAKTQKIVGAEALIRWRKADNSDIFPNEFIPIAEKTGFITFIDTYVFKLVCEKQAEWMEKGYDIVPISVNISREKLKDESFIYEYLKIIGNIGIEKEYVELEITEGDTYSYDVKTNIVDIIKDAGFKVLIDDFGVGYSSLTMLKNVHADVLKLDRSFVIDESSSGKYMLKHIIKIAKAFEYKVLAEGVETEEQYKLLLNEDCDEIQGYYFSKPLEEEDFVDKYLNKV